MKDKGLRIMVIEIDFNSDEAIYVQLMNQIIMGIATSRLQEGDPLPSVRQLADTIGINMHTVNKAYSLLRQEGFVRIWRRQGKTGIPDHEIDRTIRSACSRKIRRLQSKSTESQRTGSQRS